MGQGCCFDKERGNTGDWLGLGPDDRCWAAVCRLLLRCVSQSRGADLGLTLRLKLTRGEDGGGSEWEKRLHWHNPCSVASPPGRCQGLHPCPESWVIHRG